MKKRLTIPDEFTADDMRDDDALIAEFNASLRKYTTNDGVNYYFNVEKLNEDGWSLPIHFGQLTGYILDVNEWFKEYKYNQHKAFTVVVRIVLSQYMFNNTSANEKKVI
jgi:hypothetical protein